MLPALMSESSSEMSTRSLLERARILILMSDKRALSFRFAGYTDNCITSE